jgi:membrane fusion protein (multidrug efflux system)
MDRGRRYGAVWVALAAFGVAACGKGQASGAASEETPLARVVNVEVITIAPEAFTEYVTVTGTVQADRDVVVASEESGVIRAVHAEKGARLAAGQPIAQIEDAVLRAQFEQAQAEARLAAETWARQRRLWEEDSIGSELAYLQAKYRAETAAASARALEARLARTTIRAPIAGTLEDRTVEVGSTVLAGSAVARIVDADPVKVAAGIPERFAGEIRPGAEARVQFDPVGGREYTGRLRFVGAAVDEASRTFPIEVAIPNPGGVLKPGMVARVRTPRRQVGQALLVPRDAVLRSADGYIVYVVVPSGERETVEARSVVMGGGAEGRVAIEAGLEPGDRVVVVGQQQLAAGDFVQVTARRGRP